MTRRKTPLLDGLAERDERVRVANERVAALREEIAAHGQTIAGLKAERIAAFAEDDERKAATAKAATEKATAHAAELEERREGAEMAARRAQAERDAFVTANHPGLVAERRPVAEAIAKGIHDAVAALSEATAAWHAEAQVQAALLRTTGQRTDGIPDLPIHQLVRDLKRAASDGVPEPLPDRAQVARDPEPDGDIRDGVRAALRAKREAAKP